MVFTKELNTGGVGGLGCMKREKEKQTFGQVDKHHEEKDKQTFGCSRAPPHRGSADSVCLLAGK